MIKSTLITALCLGSLTAGLFADPVHLVEDSAFVKSHVPGPYILPSDDVSWTWGMAPIYDEDGKLHVFNSVIPNKGLGSWIKSSKIVHWTADSPEGPYTLVGDVFASPDASYHNPQISKVGDTYVLVYLLNVHTDENGSYQEVGIATTKSLDGPWVESPHNPILKATEANEFHASNPTFVVSPEGEFRIYHKTMIRKGKAKLREISLATSDKIEGPYTMHEVNPMISYADEGLDIEDPYAFYYNDHYYMILEDRRDIKGMLEGKTITKENTKSGGLRPGLIYQSKDGLNWGLPKVGYRTNEQYFGKELHRTERPSILWKDGKPEYLYLACHDEDPTAGYIVKIDGWEGE
ncbi:MAG: glycoside hydrolase family protein [Akkermansiaceae bacterium]